jgi:hypothetical protein
MQEKKETHSIALLHAHWSSLGLREITHLRGFKLLCAYVIASFGLVVAEKQIK